VNPESGMPNRCRDAGPPCPARLGDELDGLEAPSNPNMRHQARDPRLKCPPRRGAHTRPPARRRPGLPRRASTTHRKIDDHQMRGPMPEAGIAYVPRRRLPEPSGPLRLDQTGVLHRHALPADLRPAARGETRDQRGPVFERRQRDRPARAEIEQLRIRGWVALPSTLEERSASKSSDGGSRDLR